MNNRRIPLAAFITSTRGKKSYQRSLLGIERLEDRLAMVGEVASLSQFLSQSAHRYDHSENPSDRGSPAVFLYTDYLAGGAYSTPANNAGLAQNGLDGDDPNAARGTSSFRMTTAEQQGYFEFALFNERAPRDLPEYGAVHAVRFWARGGQDGQELRVKLLRSIESGWEFFIDQTIAISSQWSEYRVDLPASPVLAPKDVYSVQFQLPEVGTVRLDEVRLNTDGSDPLQLVQSYLPGGWAPKDADPMTIEGRDVFVYPSHSFLYDVALASKAYFASGDAALQALALNQLNSILATELDGSNGYFNVRGSGYALLDDNSPRSPYSFRRTVGDNAWFGLALLDAYRFTGAELYLDRAREITSWFDRELKATDALKGYSGGYDDGLRLLHWRSTEHNIDSYQLNRRIAEILTNRGEVVAAQTYASQADHAATFVLAMFDAADGKFWTGTTPEDTINTCSVPLDAQLWPILTLLQDPEYANAVDWSRAVQYAEANLAASDGAISGFSYSTNSTANRVWTEGVAQGAVAYRLLNETTKRQQSLQTLAQLIVPGGGALAVSSGTLEDDCLGAVYDARQGVAPSAWSYLAYLRLNPFENSVPANDPPVIANFGGNIPYVEGAQPSGVATGATVSDPDSPNFANGKLNARITANAEASDRLVIRTIGHVSTSGNQVRFAGQTIGTFAGGIGNTALIVTFNAQATLARVQGVLRSIGYHNVSDNPVTVARTLTVKLSDGDGGTSAPVTKSVNVMPVNDAPLLGGISGTVGYQVNSVPVILASMATVSDVDSPNFDLGKLTVRVVTGAEVSNRIELVGAFSISGNNVLRSGVVIGTLNDNAGRGFTKFEVTFNAKALSGYVQQLIRAIRFRTIGSTSTTDRAISFTVTDGDGGRSVTLTKTVDVTN